MKLYFLVLPLILGNACDACYVQFDELTFNDGPADGAAHTLYIQEGAIVDIVCKQGNAFSPFYDVDFEAAWELGRYQNGENPVDHNIFPVQKNFEPYESEESDSDENRLLSTLRYTARREDDGKRLYCKAVRLTSYLSSVAEYRAAFVDLVIRPGPTPTTYRSTVVHKWRGGFIGEINVPISDFYNSWKIILKFPKKVFNLKGGHFQVANEPCLHGRTNCGDDRKQTWVIYNTFDNRVQNPGDHLKLTFIAEVWKKNDLGLKADVDFYGYNQVFHTDFEPFSSSSDIQIN